MSSGFDDRYDDEPRYDDGGPDDRELDRRDAVLIARGRVRLPAIALLVTGLGTVVLGALLLMSAGNVDAQAEEVKAKWDADPNLTAQQKQDLKQKMDDEIKPALKAGIPVAGPLWILTGLLTAAGAVRMMTLSGGGLAKVGAILSMIPVFSWCCCLAGVPVGIWVFLVLSHPDVRAGFAAARGASGGPGGNYR